MSVMFTPFNIGSLEIKNRFIHSGTYESMADKDGFVTDQLVDRYTEIAKGGVGLIISGYMNVHPLGRGRPHQVCADNDDKIHGLKRIVNAIHENGSKACFQLIHAGRQTRKEFIGHTPLAPSSVGWDPTYFVRPRTMT